MFPDAVSQPQAQYPNPPLEAANLPALTISTARPAPSLDELLAEASFEEVRQIFLDKLLGSVDTLLAQNTEVSIERATALMRAIGVLAKGRDGEIFKERTETKRESLDDINVRGCEAIDGRLNGKACLKGRNVPLLNGQLIHEIEGKQIMDCDLIHNLEYRLNGIVMLDGGVWQPVIDGKLISAIEGQAITGCKYVRNVDGQLNGCVRIEECNFPVLNGKLITLIDGKPIKDFEDFENVGGLMNGRVSFPDKPYSYVPVLDGHIVERIADEIIDDCRNIKNINGRMNGEVRLGGYSYEYYPVQNGYLKPKKR